MNITVFGAGNLGLACCAVLSQDNDVTLYTTRPHKSRETLAYTYEEKAVASATFTVTDDMARACNAELILCTYPAFLRPRSPRVEPPRWPRFSRIFSIFPP